MEIAALTLSILAVILSGLAAIIALRKENTVTYRAELDDVQRIDDLESEMSETKQTVEEHKKILRKSKA